MPNSVSITVIRKNTKDTDILLKTLQCSIREKKITKVGMLGAKVSFSENDTDTAGKIIDTFSDLGISDVGDKILFTIRDSKGVPKTSLCCKKVELEKLLI